MKGIDSLLFAFAGASISEPFGEWVVIDFQLGNLCKWIYIFRVLFLKYVKEILPFHFGRR